MGTRLWALSSQTSTTIFKGNSTLENKLLLIQCFLINIKEISLNNDAKQKQFGTIYCTLAVWPCVVFLQLFVKFLDVCGALVRLVENRWQTLE